jgi:hypothetical protein
MNLLIGIPREIKKGENRVAATPRCVAALREAGARGLVQRDAGLGNGFPDHGFAKAGASLVMYAGMPGALILSSGGKNLPRRNIAFFPKERPCSPTSTWLHSQGWLMPCWPGR